MVNLDMLVTMFKYDNSIAKIPLPIDNHPQPEIQLQKYKQFSKDFKIDKECKLFHVVSKEWLTNWQQFCKPSEAQTPRKFPGPINNSAQLKAICESFVDDKKTMLFCDDVLNNLQIRDGVEEGVEYEVLGDRVFQYLFWIYGGTDIRRYSIEVKTQIVSETKNEPNGQINEPELEDAMDGMCINVDDDKSSISD
jgi:hypothetical protein